MWIATFAQSPSAMATKSSFAILSIRRFPSVHLRPTLNSIATLAERADRRRTATFEILDIELDQLRRSQSAPKRLGSLTSNFYKINTQSSNCFSKLA
jgi:hypothetical protein